MLSSDRHRSQAHSIINRILNIYFYPSQLMRYSMNQFYKVKNNGKENFYLNEELGIPHISGRRTEASSSFSQDS